MSTIRLQRQCSKLYNIFDKSLRIFQSNNLIGMYNKIQYDKEGGNEKSFLGRNLCGESCFILKYLLETKAYNVEVFKNERRTEFGIEDHVFLYVDNHIVDPTFRQFMVDPRSKTSNCLYQHTLFNKFHPFMVCLPNEIPQFLQNILNVNKFCYSTAFKNYDDIKHYWIFQENITNAYNLSEIIDKKEKFEVRNTEYPDYYFKMIDYITSQLDESVNPYKLGRRNTLDSKTGIMATGNFSHKN
mgnify:CR=1 FL=1